MPSIDLRLTGNGPAWPDLAAKEQAGKLIHVTQAIGISGIPNGMQSGAPSVAIRLDLQDGRVVLVETSLKLFLMAANGLRARFGDPLSGDPGTFGEKLEAIQNLFDVRENAEGFIEVGSHALFQPGLSREEALNLAGFLVAAADPSFLHVDFLRVMRRIDSDAR